MSRDPIEIVRDFTHFARNFVKAENMLLEPPVRGGSYRYFIPVWRIEQDLAFAARGVFQFHKEYQLLLAELQSPPFSIGLPRAIDQIHEMIEARLHLWGWDFILAPEGMKRVAELIKAHEDNKENPMLDAALSWRQGKGVAPHAGADELADLAVQRKIQPTMTPEEGEKKIWKRHEDWYLSPALTGVVPKASIQYHGKLADTVAELERLFRRLEAEEKVRKYTESLGREVTQTPDAFSRLGHLPVVREYSDSQREDATVRAEPQISDVDRPAERDENRNRAEPPLTNEQQYLLIAALELAAFDSDSRRTAEELVKAAKGASADPANAKKPLAGLVRDGQLDSRKGAGGGYWLTPAGKRRAIRLQ
jgi:hypothetical protein